MTDQQAVVLAAVRDFWTEKGYGPTVRELAERVDRRSTASVHRILTVLRDEGAIAWNPKCPRTIRPV